ncbi:Sporulation related domain-containing protein [Saccharicrinis carchari]|uniref:Sporulation related domain-containing protein n=1 Tax=Saccharicrinis carchari TaxID=1168039 RepID=A0A521EKG6_SACCC|nr:SPOR domain-containing protein [Saccharicrinis carchari]SMO84405.1 Sporulation related domain-containing protein [Saccharicrinis carchari]
MFKIVFTVVLCLFFGVATSQENAGLTFFNDLQSQSPGGGNLTIVQDTGIANLVGMHINANNRSKLIDGFRIQLYLGSNNNAKKEATQVKAHLLSLFPDERPYVVYEAPFWRVQVGDFRSKNEAFPLYKKLKSEFPACYPVPVNNIPLSNLK